MCVSKKSADRHRRYRRVSFCPITIRELGCCMDYCCLFLYVVDSIFTLGKQFSSQILCILPDYNSFQSKFGSALVVIAFGCLVALIFVEQVVEGVCFVGAILNWQVIHNAAFIAFIESITYVARIGLQVKKKYIWGSSVIEVMIIL